MLEMPAKVKHIGAGSFIAGDDFGQKLESRSKSGGNKGDLARTITLPHVKAVFLGLKHYSGLSAEFNGLRTALLTALPERVSFAIGLPGFPHSPIAESLHHGIAPLLNQDKQIHLPALAAEIAQTWEFLKKTAFAIDGATHCTLNFETQSAKGKPWHKDAPGRRPGNSAIAIRWFNREPPAAFSLKGTFTEAGKGGKTLLHDIDEALLPSGADLALLKPEEVIHGILPVNEQERWSYTITCLLKPAAT